MLCLPCMLRAQSTLTVYDGTVANYYIPANIYYFDQYTRSQFVIPADSLEEMMNGTISGLTFYTNSTNVPYTTECSVEVYLTEVNYTTMSGGFEPKGNASIVYIGLLAVQQTANGGILTIEFTTPYIYTGGNLLIGVENTEKANYKSIRYFGKTITGAARRANNSNSLNNVAGSVVNFAPKTTFTYSQGVVVCPRPRHLAVDNISAHTAELSWDAGGEESSWEICLNGDENNLITVNTNTFTLQGLAPEAQYNAKVRADCGTEYSEWSNSVSFTTDYSDILPCDSADLCDITFQLADSYGDGWNGNAIRVVCAETSYLYGTLTLEDGSEGTQTVSVCKNRELKFVWVKGQHSNEPSWKAYDINMEEIFSGKGSNAMLTGDIIATYTVICQPCSKPTELIVSYLGGSTAEVSWSGDAASYNIDFNGTLIQNVTSPYTLENLLPNTLYEVKVQSNCGEVTSTWAVATFFTQVGCLTIRYDFEDSYGDGWNGNAIRIMGSDCELLESLTMTNGDHATGSFVLCDTYARFEWVKGNYSNETSWTFFDVNGEVLFSGTGNNSMPTGTVLHVLDYAPTPRPDNLDVLETGTRSVTLAWTENGEATSWQIILNDDEENIIEASSNPFTLTGLVPETGYTANVRSVGTDDTSHWTCSPVSFTTLEECKIPTGLQALVIEPHSATIDWTENGEATEWVVSYKATGSDDGFVDVTTTSNPLTLTGLEPETRYTVMVRPVCDFEAIKWSDEFMFVSGIACHAPTELTATNIVPASANISWTGDAESYDLRYIEGNDYSEEGWLHYDDGITMGGISTITNQYFAVMFPAGSYAGNQVSKIALFNSSSIQGTVTVYNDGASSPAQEVGSMNISPFNGQEWTYEEYAFDSPVFIDPSKNLWIVLHIENDGSAYSSWVSSQNGYWASPNGTSWYNYSGSGALMIRAFVGDESSQNWTEVDNLTASTYEMTGLNPSTDYKVQVRSNCGEEGLSQWTASTNFRTLDSCEPPYDVYASDITSCSAVLNWTGWHDDYSIQYHTFEKMDVSQFSQIGEDVVTTGTMSTYTFDLSAYSGIGSIAIQHINPINGNVLTVDEIFISDAEGDTVLYHDFGSFDDDEWWNLPDGWFVFDRNHDGYSWDISSDGDNLLISSFGYENEDPDNWLVISNIQLGGAITFKAWEGNPSGSNSAFGVFVTTAPSADWYVSDEWHQAMLNSSDNSIELNNLQPNTTYEFYVGGSLEECGGYYNFSWPDYRFTTSSCPAVTGLTAQVGSDGVLLDWTGGEGNTSWLVRYRAQTEENWTEAVADAETYTIGTPLEPGLYVAEVRAVCDEGNQACWTSVSFNICNDTYGFDEQTACESFEWMDGNIYTESTDTPTWTLTNAAGCDSIVTLHLTIHKPAHTSTTVETCDDPYLWEVGSDELSLYESGTYSWEYEDANGCMQVDTIHLTIHQPDYTYLEDVACEGFTYAKNGFVITPEEGAATHQHFLYLTNAAGCDSTVSLYLTYQTCDLTCGNDIEDIDGNTYGTMGVNNLCWMTSNLRATHYYDAVEIPFAIGYSYPFNPSDESNVETYGRLYNWASASRGATAQPIQGACPEGWRLPSQAEFSDLFSAFSVHQLRSTSNWLANSGDNSSGFNMQPGGYYNGASGSCERMFGTAYFYTSDMLGASEFVHLFSPCHCDEFIFEIGHNGAYGYSIRCVKEIE